MDQYWIASVEKSLRKEKNPSVQRTIHIIQDQSRDEFMKNFLDSLAHKGCSSFSSQKKRSADLYQWRCERSNKPRGSSSGQPHKTKANACPAYVSFQFLSSTYQNGCVVRYLGEHRGHDLTCKENAVSQICCSAPQQICFDIKNDAESSAVAADILLQHSYCITETVAPPNRPISGGYSVESLLSGCKRGRKKRYTVGIAEIKRRCAAPECMSADGVLSYLRKGKDQRGTITEELEQHGIALSGHTEVESACTKLTEGEVEALIADLGTLANKFRAPVTTIVKLETRTDKEMEILKCKQIRYSMAQTLENMQPYLVDFDLVTHGMGSKMIKLSTDIMSSFLQQQEKVLASQTNQ